MRDMFALQVTMQANTTGVHKHNWQESDSAHQHRRNATSQGQAVAMQRYTCIYAVHRSTSNSLQSVVSLTTTCLHTDWLKKNTCRQSGTRCGLDGRTGSGVGLERPSRDCGCRDCQDGEDNGDGASVHLEKLRVGRNEMMYWRT